MKSSDLHIKPGRSQNSFCAGLTRGQATLESLFVMFLMFMLIAAIYQMFLIHNTLYQMAANAYYEAFKEARNQNNTSTAFNIDINRPLKLTKAYSSATDDQTLPVINLFRGSVSMRVNRQFWIGSGVKGEIFSIPDFGSSVSNANAQTPASCTGCGCMVDGEHSVGATQVAWMSDNLGQQPPFPYTTRAPDSKGKYPASPGCPAGSPYCLAPGCH